MVNDCVGTLVLGAYHDSDCRVAVILGTGTNAALFVPRSRLWQAGEELNGHGEAARGGNGRATAGSSGDSPSGDDDGSSRARGSHSPEDSYRRSRDRQLVLSVARHSPNDQSAQAAAEVVWEEEEGDPDEACGINTEWASFRERSLLPWSSFDDAIEADFEQGSAHPPRRL